MKIATSKTARSKVWRNTETTWEKLVAKLQTPKVMPFTLKEYLAKPKQEQSTLKDVGGYVGGYLKEGSRKIDKVASRQLLTLDIDNNPQSDLLYKLEALGIATVIHSTFKSTADKPRYRIIAPLDAPVSSEQYQAIARSIANSLGLEQFDPTTFEPHRLMYWPAKPSDTEYIFEHIEGAPIDTEQVLSSYLDWTDTSEWPMHESAKERVQTKIKKLEDPTTKQGIVGAFCRTYDIHEAISEFLSEVYTPTADPNRYTYVAGETAAGLIVYEDLWAYSHHGTDPISQRECNAFDLVRIHLYGELDKDEPEGKAVTSLASYKAMQERASEDGNLKHLLIEQRQVTSDDFGVDGTTDPTSPDFDEETYNREWRARLKYKPKSVDVEATIENARLIFDYDLRLRDCFKWDRFVNEPRKTKPLDWDKRDYPRGIDDTDYPQLRAFFSSQYGLVHEKHIADALTVSAMAKPYHPIIDYLEGLNWDGKPRVDTILIDLFNTPDTIFMRAAVRKVLCAAVARIYAPGTKFDYMLVLTGEQGIGKSTFAERLCYKNREWFNDNFGYSAKENKMAEDIRGKWIVEMSEMKGWRKAEVSEMKQFISRTKDEYRAAYAKGMTRTPRSCVFIASTNENEFLYDPTGDRRYWPIAVRKGMKGREAWDLSDADVDQLWAEAKHLYENGEKLYLSPEEELGAKEAQETYTVRDSKLGQVDIYLDIPIPTPTQEWYRRELIDRRQWIEEHSRPDSEWADKSTSTQLRETVSVAEIWCECFRKPREDMSKTNTREINDMMRAHPEWEYVSKPARFGDYGVQRYYKRKSKTDDTDKATL